MSNTNVTLKMEVTTPNKGCLLRRLNKIKKNEKLLLPFESYKTHESYKFSVKVLPGPRISLNLDDRGGLRLPLFWT